MALNPAEPINQQILDHSLQNPPKMAGSASAAEEIDEAKEREHFRAVVNAFKYYKLCCLERIHKSEKIVSGLPASHQSRLTKYASYLTEFKKCLDVNNAVVHLIIKDVDKMFENVDRTIENENGDGSESFGGDYNSCELASHKTHKVQHDVEKVQSVLKNIVRDWSEVGATERAQCYLPILHELEELYPKDDPEYSTRSAIGVLVPGAGLGRLAWEVADRGFVCQGNEFSLFMLFASNFIINKCPEINKHTVHPWVHQYVNNLTCDHQLQAARFPDVKPSRDHKNHNFSMTAGDFLKEENGISTLYLKKTKQKIWLRKQCATKIGWIPEGTFCAANGYNANEQPSSGQCASGDSGSALVVNGYQQVGIVSFKRPSVSSDIVVYTDVGYFSDWIHRKANQLYC